MKKKILTAILLSCTLLFGACSANVNNIEDRNKVLIKNKEGESPIYEDSP